MTVHVEIEDGVDVNDEADRKILAMKKFVINSRIMKSKCTSLYLNISLINHSCSPNAVEGYLKPYNENESIEVRATKSIVKGEEVTICYEKDFFKLCCSLEARRTAIKKGFLFDCNCQYCASPDQEDLMLELFWLHADWNDANAESPDCPNKKLSHWAREAEILCKIVSLNQKIHMGGPQHKWTMMSYVAKVAHLARNQGLVKKAMQMLEDLAGATKMEIANDVHKNLKQDLFQRSSQLLSNQPPSMEEIDFFFPS